MIFFFLNDPLNVAERFEGFCLHWENGQQSFLDGISLNFKAFIESVNYVNEKKHHISQLIINSLWQSTIVSPENKLGSKQVPVNFSGVNKDRNILKHSTPVTTSAGQYNSSSDGGLLTWPLRCIHYTYLACAQFVVFLFPSIAQYGRVNTTKTQPLPQAAVV